MMSANFPTSSVPTWSFKPSSSAALLVAALTTRPDLLLAATEDRLHQEFRRSAMPASLSLVDRLRDEEYAAFVSGAGPSVVVLLPGDQAGGATRLAELAPESWKVARLDVTRRGARVGE